MEMLSSVLSTLYPVSEDAVQVRVRDYIGCQAVCRTMKGSSQAPNSFRAAPKAAGYRISKDALCIVFDHRLVLPEYIVKFDLLPTNMGAQHLSTSSVAVASPMLLRFLPNSPPVQDPSEQPAVGGTMDSNSECSGATNQIEQVPTSQQVDNIFPARETATEATEGTFTLSYKTAASVAAVRRHAPEVASHCRDLGGFLLAAEHVGSDTVNPALVNLPASVRETAEAALAMPPLVRTLLHIIAQFVDSGCPACLDDCYADDA
jgi:hypothetical protein